MASLPHYVNCFRGFNLFVGGLQTTIPFYLISHAKGTDEILLASEIFL